MFENLHNLFVFVMSKLFGAMERPSLGSLILAYLGLVILAWGITIAMALAGG